MPDRPTRVGPRDAGRTDPQAQKMGGGYEGAGPEYGRGYGRDFGGGGLNQGFDGSWGRGYGGSLAPSDYREGFGGAAYGGGMTASDYELSYGGRSEDVYGPDDRSWIDRCTDDECMGRPRHYAGRGPKGWARDDQRLYEDVCERLMHDPLIDARGVEVEVHDGTVIVRGYAAAPADPALISRLVRETPGVRGVDISLIVRPRGETAVARAMPDLDDPVDKSSLAAPILPGRAPPPDSAGSP